MRMPSRTRIVAALAGMALSASLAAATPAPKITMSAQEQKAVAGAACGAAGLDAATPRSTRKGVAASVRCRSHAKDGEVPVGKVAQCEKKGTAWKCAPARDALLVTLFDDSVLPVVTEGVRAVEAVQVVDTIAGMKVPPFQNGAIDVMQGECTLRQLRSGSSRARPISGWTAFPRPSN